jgi:CheY-like chemotaxis protein
MRLTFNREIFVKQRVKILVVDDEAIVRRSIKLLLEYDGHEVWPVDCGEAALAELAQRSFDLVITDFSMPGMHGDQLVARIRQLLPTQPIIMATAFVADYKIFGQASSHVDAFLFKPFSLKELREAVGQALTPELPAQTNDLVSIITPSPAQEFIPLPEP